MEGSVRKIGILGGTFNPPHYGHICMALAALSEGGLDEVLWVPNGDPPHKMPEVSAADRLWMTGGVFFWCDGGKTAGFAYVCMRAGDPPSRTELYGGYTQRNF